MTRGFSLVYPEAVYRGQRQLQNSYKLQITHPENLRKRQAMDTPGYRDS